MVRHVGLYACGYVLGELGGGACASEVEDFGGEVEGGGGEGVDARGGCF